MSGREKERERDRSKWEESNWGFNTINWIRFLSIDTFGKGKLIIQKSKKAEEQREKKCIKIHFQL